MNEENSLTHDQPTEQGSPKEEVKNDAENVAKVSQPSSPNTNINLDEVLQEKDRVNKELELKVENYAKEIEELRQKLFQLQNSNPPATTAVEQPIVTEDDKKSEEQPDEKPSAEQPEEKQSISIEIPITGDNNPLSLTSKSELPLTNGENLLSPTGSITSQDNATAVLFKKELDAAEFLFRRATTLHDDGWYERAQPLYDEGCIIYEKLYGKEHLQTLESTRLKAFNLYKCSKYQLSYALYNSILQSLEKISGDQSEDYLRTECDYLHLLIDIGQFAIAADRVEFIISFLNLKVENATNMNNDNKNTDLIKRFSLILGRCFCLQAIIYMTEGKLTEAKSVADRGQAVISQALGLNNVQIIYAFQTKAKVLLALAKPKEAVSIMEQALMVMKGLLKAAASNNISESPNKKEKQNKKTRNSSMSNTASTDSAENLILAEKEFEHPIIAECLFIQSKALFIQCNFLEGQNKLIKVKKLFQKYYHRPDDLPLLEVEYQEAQIAMALSYYQKSLEIHHNLLPMIEKKIETMIVKSEVSNDVASPGGSGKKGLPKSPNVRKGSLRKSISTNPAENNTELFEEIDLTNHPLLAPTYHALGMLYLKLGNFTIAKEFFNKTVRQLKKFPSHLLVYDSKIQLLSIMQQQGQFAESFPYIEDATEKIRKTLPKEHLLTISLQLLLAQVYGYKKEYEDSQRLLEKSLKVMKMNYTTGHSMIPYIMIDLIQLLIRQGETKYEEARKLLDECKMISMMIYGGVVTHEIFIQLDSIEQLLLVYEYRTLLANHEILSLTSEKKASLDGDDESLESQEKIEKEDIPKTEEEAEITARNSIHSTGNRSTASLQKPPEVTATATEEENDEKGDDEEEEEEDDGLTLPSYNNEVFMNLIDSLGKVTERFSNLYQINLPSTASKIVAINLNITTELSIPGSLLSVYMKGLLGEAKLMEFVSAQQYVGSLSTEQREIYYAIQAEKAATKLGATTTSNDQKKAETANENNDNEKPALSRPTVVIGSKGLEPPGKTEMENAIATLKSLVKEKDTYYLDDLEKQFRSLELQFDELEIAKYQLLRAHECKKMGMFLNADKLYDESFVLFFNCLGASNASKSIILAEILFNKAENGRLLSKNIDYIKNLHLLAIRIYRRSVAATAAAAPTTSTTQNKNDSHHRDTNNHEFIWKNLFALARLLVDQRLFEEVLPMHKSLHDIIVTSSLSDVEREEEIHGEEDNIDVLKKHFPHIIQRMVEKKDVSRLQYLIHAKIAIAKDLLHLYRFEEALKYDAEALDLLKKLSIITAIVSTSASNSHQNTPNATARGLRKSVEFATDVKPTTTITNAEQNDLLAESLIRLYCNEIQIQDYLGNFPLAEEYYQQIDGILESWKKSAATLIAASEELKDGTPGSPSSVKNKNGAPASPSRAPIPPRLPAIIQLVQSDIYLIRAEHLFLLNRCNESREFLNQSYQIRIKLFNFVKKITKSSLLLSSKKSSTKSTKDTTNNDPAEGNHLLVELDWTPQKEEEMKMKFLSAIEILITSDFIKEMHQQQASKKAHQIQKNIAEHNRKEPVVLTKSDKNDNINEVELGKGIGDDEETLDDVESMLLSVHEIKKDFGDSKSVASSGNTSNMQDNGGEMMIESFMPKPNSDVTFEYQNTVINAHIFFIDIFHLFTRLYHLLGQSIACKETLDIALQMFYNLFPQYKISTNHSLYKLELMKNYANYQLLTNHIEESKNLHLKFLENQMSIIVSHNEIHLGLSSSLQSIAEIYLRLGQYENAMQYFNDALKIERKCFAFPRAPPVMTPTGGNISQADNNINVPSYLLHKDSHYRIQQILISCAEILTEKCFYADSNQLCDSILLQLKFYYQSIHELHFNVAKLYMLKGRNDLGLAKIELSLQFFLQSKNILTVIYDENHYQVGIIYYYCAQVMRMMGKLLETKQYLDTSIKLVRSSLGKYHYYTLLIIYEIGLNFMDLGKYNTADHVIQRAYYLLKKLLSHSGKTSTDHLIIARMMNSLGELYLKMGFLDKVNEFLENSLFICRKVMGTDRFCMIPLILANINALKCAKGVYDLALQGIESCLSMIKLIYPSIPNHYDIIQLNFVYASILYAQGRYYEAQLLYDKIYHSMKMLYPGQDHPIYYEAQYGIANCYLVLGKLDYAKALYERCLSSLKDWKGSLHPIIGNILNRLGDIYNLYYKFQLAETVLKEAWSIRCKIMKPVNENHPDIVENLLSIAENLRLRGMFDATINFKKENTRASDKKSVLTASTASFDQGDKESGKGNRPISRGDDDVVHDIIDGKTSPEKPHQANTNEKQGNDIEEMSAPTVMISTIEMLDNDQQSTDSQNINQTEEKLLEGSSKRQDASSLSQFDDPNDPNILFFDPKQYKAVPILTKATNHLMNYLNKDVNHPLYLKTRFLLAEIKKGLGKYEKALEMHEVLFQQRRKILTEAHLDTIASLTAIAELLRIMKRVFGNNPQQQKIHHTVASDPNNMIGSGPKMTGNVTLVEHLTAIALPMNQDRLASRKGGKKKSDDEFYDYGDDGGGGGDNDDIYGDEVDGLLAKISMKKTLALIQNQQWKFISRPSEDPALLDSKQQKERADEKERKKQVLLKKGYMGFAFPPLKKETRPVNVDTILGGTGGGGNGSNSGNNNNSNQNADPKKCLDLSISLLRKIFYPMIHSSGEDTSGNGNPTSVYDHPLLALCLYNKAEILRIKGDGMMALKLLEQSLGMRRRIFRSHHPLIADCLYAMAELLRSDQRYLQALPIYDKALEIRTETYGNNHPAIAEVQNSVGLLYMSLGNYSKAEELLNSALTICEGILGIKHPSTALIYNNHAGLLQSMGKYQEAVNVNKKTLLIKQQLYTENHPEVANTLNNLGLLYKHLKSFEKSLLYYQKALEIQQQYYSSNHPEIATTYNNIGSLLALMDGKRFEAKEYFKQSLTIRMICFGKENALVASTMNNYAGLLYSLHEYTQAKEFFEDALAIRRKIFTDENHPSIGESYHNLGYFYFMQKYYLDAKFYYEEALKIRKKCYQDQDDHIHLINTYLHLIFVYDQLKMYDLSYQCIEKVIKGKMMKYANNEKHPEIIYVNELKDAIEKKILLQKQGVKKNLKQNNVMNVNPSLISNSSSASSFVTKKKNEILGGSVPTSPVHQRAAGTGSLEGDNNEIPANLSLQDHSTFDVSNVNNVNLALGEHAME